MILGRFDGTPVGMEVVVIPGGRVGDDAAMIVVGSHMDVAVFVPVGIIVSGAVVGIDVIVTEAKVEVGKAVDA